MMELTVDRAPLDSSSTKSTSKAPWSFRWGLSLGLLLGCVITMGAALITWTNTKPSSSPFANVYRSGKVGAAPLVPTMCRTQFTNSESIGVVIEVDGKNYTVVPDTGSSNFNLASSVCGEKCDVHPAWPVANNDTSQSQGTFEVVYGTGGIQISLQPAKISLGGVTNEAGTVGAIVTQYAGVDGFNAFPGPSDQVCYNSYAGILGLAYRGQDAGPAADNSKTTTNGTTVPVVDQLVASAGMPNAFALEICQRYPLPCGPRTDLSTWNPSRTCTVNYNIGHLYMGGYRSSSLATEMQYTPISDEIHYNVVLLGIEVCGSKGCENVSFPDKIGGSTEDECVCKTPNCSIPLDKDEYCYFTVVDSGADGLFMNTVENTKALISSMINKEVVKFPDGKNATSDVHSFYYDKTAVLGAEITRTASVGMYFPDMDGKPFYVSIDVAALFQQTMAGLVQMAVQSNLQAAAAFQAGKFPVLLGSTVLQGKVTFFDRSRKRLGFANVLPEKCGEPVQSEAEIDVRGKVTNTPGAGCRRGTGSGGGCAQAQKPHTKNAY